MSHIPLLAELSDATVNGGPAASFDTPYIVRKSARAILVRDDGYLAIQHLTNHHFHKLPGGGVEAGESPEEAVLREIKEEVGCTARIERPLGLVIEYRATYQLLHLSYGFLCTATSSDTTTAFEADEVAAGQINIWIPATEARYYFITDTPTTYEGHFILQRERAFLEEWQRTT